MLRRIGHEAKDELAVDTSNLRACHSLLELLEVELACSRSHRQPKWFARHKAPPSDIQVEACIHPQQNGNVMSIMQERGARHAVCNILVRGEKRS